MPQILIPLNAGESPVICSKHKQPITKESYVSYEVTETEHTFWKILSKEEKARLRDEAFHRCFYEVLHESMGKTKRLFHGGSL